MGSGGAHSGISLAVVWLQLATCSHRARAKRPRRRTYFDPDDVQGWEHRAGELLREASEARPADSVFELAYEMAYLSDLPESERPKEQYASACRRARAVVAARCVVPESELVLLRTGAAEPGVAG